MSVRTDGLGGVPCAGSRGAAKDRPGGQRFCGHTPVATLWVGWTLKLSIGGCGRYFKKSKVSFSVQIPRTHLDLLLSYLWSLQIRFFLWAKREKMRRECTISFRKTWSVYFINIREILISELGWLAWVWEESLGASIHGSRDRNSTNCSCVPAPTLRPPSPPTSHLATSSFPARPRHDPPVIPRPLATSSSPPAVSSRIASYVIWMLGIGTLLSLAGLASILAKARHI